MQRRFHASPEVAERLATSEQIRALLRNGAFEGIQSGRRGQWCVEKAKLKGHIERIYAQQWNRVATDGI